MSTYDPHDDDTKDNDLDDSYDDQELTRDEYNDTSWDRFNY